MYFKNSSYSISDLIYCEKFDNFAHTMLISFFFFIILDMNNGFVLLYAIDFHCKCITVNSGFSLFSDESK